MDNWWQRLGRPSILPRSRVKEDIKGTQFYVYIIWRSDNRPLTPFYVGKGSGIRVLQHEMDSEHINNPFKARIIKKLLKDSHSVGYSLEYFDDESAAHQREVELIALIGRRNRDKGPLANLTDGGEGTVGHIGLRGEDNPRARAVFCDGIRYGSTLDASRELGITDGAIRIRCETGWPGYYFEDEGQQPEKEGRLFRYKKPVSIDGKEYESLSEAARQLDCDLRLLHKRINFGWPGYFYVEEGQRPRRRPELPLEVEGVRFESRKEAAKFFGLHSVDKRLASENFPEWIDLSGRIEKRKTGKARQPITVDGRFFNSLVEAARETGIKRATLGARARSSNYPDVVCPDIPKEYRDPDLAKDAIEVTVDGKAYPSLSEAARVKDIDIGTLKARLKSPACPTWTCDDQDLQKQAPKDGRPSRIAIIIDGKRFRSINAAHKELGLRRPKIKERCKSDDPAWQSWCFEYPPEDLM
jgi:hypothetical protein